MNRLLVSDITSCIERFAPLALQEGYDNSGLQVGNLLSNVESVMLTVDITEEVIDEAIVKGINMVIAHHPLIFSGLKRLTGKTEVERIVEKAIKHNVCIYASHTNLDIASNGVSFRMGEKLGLKKLKVLEPLEDRLQKIVVFVPTAHLDAVRQAMFDAGAGNVGNYSSCSYSHQGEGTFKAEAGAYPFVGKVDELHVESEIRLEVVCPSYFSEKVVRAMVTAHPYEEVAYDIIPLVNKNPYLGLGAVGEFVEPIAIEDFLLHVKKTFGAMGVRYTAPASTTISRVAMCGGSGSSLIGKAIASGAQAFITGDIKYHNFFDAKGKLLLMDIGHFESEYFSLEIISDLLKKNFPNFAVYIAETKSNPINYL